jgi:hypothetical protein
LPIGKAWPDQARTDVHGSAGEPVGIAPGKARGRKPDRAKVEAARRDVGLADARLVAAEADAQPAVGTEGTGRFDERG